MPILPGFGRAVPSTQASHMVDPGPAISGFCVRVASGGIVKLRSSINPSICDGSGEMWREDEIFLWGLARKY
jgi:hypothetical protein